MLTGGRESDISILPSGARKFRETSTLITKVDDVGVGGTGVGAGEAGQNAPELTTLADAETLGP